MMNWMVKARQVSLDCARVLVFSVGMLTISLMASLYAHGQLPQSSLPPDASGHVQGSKDSEDDVQREMLRKQELHRNEDRQKELVRDTDKLMVLATDLKSEVDKTNKDVLSVDVVKKAEEIEKLARSVKDRMRAR